MQGLRNAYCEAMDCDDPNPQASDQACSPVLIKIEDALPEGTAFPTCQDVDDDGVPHGLDNCPNDPNPDQADSNGNGVGDVREVPEDPFVVPTQVQRGQMFTFTDPQRRMEDGDDLRRVPPAGSFGERAVPNNLVIIVNPDGSGTAAATVPLLISTGLYTTEVREPGATFPMFPHVPIEII